MKAISLWQPWATLIALNEKRIETRGRRINHRGEIAIHAAQKWTLEQAALLNTEPFRSRLAHHGITSGSAAHWNMPRGAVVAVVELVDDIDLACGLPFIHGFEPGPFEGKFGNYGTGRRGYLLRNIRPLREPVLCRGMQAVPFELPADVVRSVAIELEDVEPWS